MSDCQLCAVIQRHDGVAFEYFLNIACLRRRPVDQALTGWLTTA